MLPGQAGHPQPPKEGEDRRQLQFSPGAEQRFSPSVFHRLVHPVQLLEYQMVQALCRFDINLVQTVVPDWRQIELLMALDLIIISAVGALPWRGDSCAPRYRRVEIPVK